MSQRKRPLVLAIGIDAAEPTLVKRLIDEKRLPALEQLLDAGRWRPVISSADIGSGSVWPTFTTGLSPSDHGVYGEWAWRPESMTVIRRGDCELPPFWKTPARLHTPVGVLDVPFAPLVGVETGFEVKEWGAHDAVDGHTAFAPADIAPLISRFSPHPLTNFSNTGTLAGTRALERLVADCLDGVVSRGALARELISERQPVGALVVFTEVHHASHFLWHTVAPDHELYAGLARPGPLRPGLEEILEAVDREIGRLVEAAGPDAAVMVFSLHGMRPALGIPAFLGPLLCERGLSRLAQWSTQSGGERIASLVGRLKQRAPASLKRLYQGSVPAAARRRMARPTMMPVYDWTATRAVALPTDQHGWIRVNLAGREAAGIVPLERYDATCDEIAAFVRSLRNQAGQPLVRSVIRTAERPADAIEMPLPDLVVHWEERACAAPFAIQGSQVTGQTVSANLTSQHAFGGFCLWRGAGDTGGDGPIVSTAMHRILLDAMAAVRAQ